MSVQPTRKRPGWRIMLAGLGGYLLGAATVLLVLWLYGERLGRQGPPVAYPPIAEATPAPSPPAAQPWRVPSPIPGPAPGEPAAAPPPATGAAAVDLAIQGLPLPVPVQGIDRNQLSDTFNDSRGGGSRVHEALDIMAPRNSPILAIDDGRIVKLFISKQGGLTIYQFDPTETYCYYYAHLERYADGLQEGQAVRRGQLIGYVGTSGNANPDGPHLHFAIFRLNADKKWWQGTPIDPYPLIRGQQDQPAR
jgi:murein DD-endopeptidase MepM/ murein hydrolase activator NlpD